MGHCSLILNSYPSVLILGENSKVHANSKEFSLEEFVLCLVRWSCKRSSDHHNIMIILKLYGTKYDF